MTAVLIILFILMIALGEIGTKKALKLAKFKPFLYFLLTLIFIILSDYESFRKIIPLYNIRIVVTANILSSIFIYLLFDSLESLRSYESFYKTAMLAFMIMVSGLEGAGNILLFSPCLLYIVDRKWNENVYFTTFVGVTWVSFLFLQNVASLNIDSLLYFVLGVCFYRYFDSIYYSNFRLFEKISLPAILLYQVSTNVLQHVNNFVLALLIVIGATSLIRKLLKKAEAQQLILLLPIILHLGKLMNCDTTQINIMLLYVYILYYVVRINIKKIQATSSLLSIIILAMFLVIPILPFQVYIDSMKILGFDSLYYTMIIVINLIVGVVSCSFYEKLSFEFNRSKKDIISGLLGPLSYVLLVIVSIYLLQKLISNTEQGNERNTSNSIVYIIGMLSYLIGIMSGHICSKSKMVKYIGSKIFYRIKTIESLSRGSILDYKICRKRNDRSNIDLQNIYRIIHFDSYNYEIIVLLVSALSLVAVIMVMVY